MRPSYGEPVLVTIMSRREIVARGTTALLSEHPDRVLTVTLPSITTWRQRIDVAVYDLALLHQVGEDHLVQVVGRLHGRVVALGGTGSALAHRARVLGVAGCLGLDADAGELLDGVMTAASGGRIEPVPAPHELLTPQERAIAALIAEGQSNKEIAAQLYISTNTLKSHIRAAYRKMGVRSRPQAVAWCARHGISSLDVRAAG